MKYNHFHFLTLTSERKNKQLATETVKIHVEKAMKVTEQFTTRKRTVEIKDTDIHFIHEQKGTRSL